MSRCAGASPGIGRTSVHLDGGQDVGARPGSRAPDHTDQPLSPLKSMRSHAREKEYRAGSVFQSSCPRCKDSEEALDATSSRQPHDGRNQCR